MNNTSLVFLCFLISYLGLNIHAQFEDDSENDNTEENSIYDDNTEEDSIYDDFVIDSSESGNQPEFITPFVGKLQKTPFAIYLSELHDWREPSITIANAPVEATEICENCNYDQSSLEN
ncbi:uncharacterized protein [Periplaneta americana]|uniref:uncharacterized protein isoform X1 n=1 Tax=Periplaneta americana TaxID=6978 RepID=UPI0037E8CA04